MARWKAGKVFTLALSAMIAGGGALAHDAGKGPNGGLQVDAGAYHAELVVDGSPNVAVYLSDAGHKEVAAAGFAANAIFVVAGKPQRFTLAPAGGSKLAGTAPVGIPSGAKGAIQLTAPDGGTAQAKF